MARYRLPLILATCLLFGLLGCSSRQELGIHVKPSSVQWKAEEVISLHKAIRTGDLAVVKKLLDSKGNPNAIAENGGTPLYALFQNTPFPGGPENRYRIAVALFRAGANPNEYLPDRLSAGGVRVATWAFHRDTDRMVRLFLQAGLNPDLQDKTGQSVIFTVVSVNSIDGADLLLKAGASINHVDRFGQNCLFHANTPEIGKFLVEHGANIQQHNNKGKSVVGSLMDQSLYCGSGGCTEIPAEIQALAKYLLSHGAPQ